MSAVPVSSAGGPALQPAAGVSSSTGLLELARRYDRKGHVEEAAGAYEAAVRLAEEEGQGEVLAEALRRLAVVHQRRQEGAAARALCERSREVARALGVGELTAEALNTLAGIELMEANYPRARALFAEALDLAGEHADLRGRIEQNLGTVESMQGNHAAAIPHYRRSVEAFLAAGNESGCALAYHNLSVIGVERRHWEEADRYSRLSLRTAEWTGDTHLRGLGLLNRAEVLLALGNAREARHAVEAAIRVFDELRAPGELADAYRILGVVCREAGDFGTAGAKLRLAIEFAAACESALGEAEAERELAQLYARTGRLPEAVALLTKASRELVRLKPGHGLEEVVEGRLPPSVSSWGELVRSLDRATAAHAERVSAHAVRMARLLGLDLRAQATVRVGAYLHDVGKIHLPAAILGKPGRLTPAEYALVQQHPIRGAELVAALGLPWDIGPLVRWHHEKVDGSGYPDRLQGDAIPVEAQIVGILDVHDALTTERTYRRPLPPAEAMAELAACRAWWRADVFEAFARGAAAGS